MPDPKWLEEDNADLVSCQQPGQSPHIDELQRSGETLKKEIAMCVLRTRLKDLLPGLAHQDLTPEEAGFLVQIVVEMDRALAKLACHGDHCETCTLSGPYGCRLALDEIRRKYESWNGK